MDFPDGSASKGSACNAEDTGDLGSIPGGGNDNPLQYFCLENCMDREAWWATVQIVSESLIRLSAHTVLNEIMSTNHVASPHHLVSTWWSVNVSLCHNHKQNYVLHLSNLILLFESKEYKNLKTEEVGKSSSQLVISKV